MLNVLAQPLSPIRSRRISWLKKALQVLISISVLVVLWQGAITIWDLPSFILPTPLSVFDVLTERYTILFKHTWITAQEILIGLLLGVSIGLFFALQMLLFASVRRWLLPILIASQAIPVFAIAPILMLWLDYGIASKVAMAAIIIFFPVTTCCYDGLRSTPQGYLDLAHTLGANRWRRLWHVQLPAALPALGSGLRVAVVIAPIGAVVGEWVGSSAGLGYLMLQANARMMIDEMFAALFILSLFSVALYFSVDWLLKKLIPWHAQ